MRSRQRWLLGAGCALLLAACGLARLLYAPAPVLQPAWSAEGRDVPAACPFGHTGVKQIPILYGLLAVDDALQRKFDALEVWPGGCLVSEEKQKTVCPVCRYARDWPADTWTLYSPNKERFRKPLCALMQAIPVPAPEMLGGILNYYQTVTPSGRVVQEKVVFWTKEPEEIVLDKICSTLMAQCHLRKKPNVQKAQDRATVTVLQPDYRVSAELGPRSREQSCVVVEYRMIFE